MENLYSDKFSYFILLIVSGIVPFIFSFIKKYGFVDNYKYALISIVLVAIPFIIWDILATERGHWSFNPQFITGIIIINLPLEEIMFFLVIPFCCLFTWNVMKRLEKEDQ